MNEQRTTKQNKALHVYCEELAVELNNAGLDMKAVLKPEIDIPWNGLTVKEYIWRPIQKAALKKESTTELTTAEVNQIFEIIHRHISMKFGLDVPFPSVELLDRE